MARNVFLHYSPDEDIWYYQKADDQGAVSTKSYGTKEEALADYHATDSPYYEWE